MSKPVARLLIELEDINPRASGDGLTSRPG